MMSDLVNLATHIKDIANPRYFDVLIPSSSSWIFKKCVPVGEVVTIAGSITKFLYHWIYVPQSIHIYLDRKFKSFWWHLQTIDASFHLDLQASCRRHELLGMHCCWDESTCKHTESEEKARDLGHLSLENLVNPRPLIRKRIYCRGF